jgi:3-isopropylmalate dehydrogenase
MTPTIALVPGQASTDTAFAGIADQLEAVRGEVDLPLIELGPAAYRRSGTPLPDSVLEQLRAAGAIVMATPPNPGKDDTDLPPGLLEHGIVFALRTKLALSVNIRRFRGIGPHAGLDISVVRENSEGLYFSPGTVSGAGTSAEAATQEVVTSRSAVERCLRHGFSLARVRRVPLGIAHKVRVLTASGAIWTGVAERLAVEFPDVPWRVENIDTCCGRLVADPGAYGVIATDNVFGDILADVVSARLEAGEYAVSVEYAADSDGPSLFEPMHDTYSSAATHEKMRDLGLAAAFGTALQHVGLTGRGGSILDDVQRRVELLAEALATS